MKRNSNLELLRIIAILAIIAYHFEVQCIRKIIPADTIQYCFAMFLGSFGRTGVNVFVLIGAWFLIDLPFRSMRVVRLYLATILYTVPITLIILFLGVKSDGVSGKELFAAFTPFTSGPLWFVSCYLFLLLVSPFLNILIHTLSPHMYRTLYWILLVVLVFMANRRGIPGHFFFKSDAFFMVALYLIVGYWKTIQLPFFASRSWALLSILVLIAGCAAFCAGYYFSIGRYRAIEYICRQSHDYLTREIQSVFCFWLAGAAFFFFQSFSFSSNMVNRIAKNVLGVYLLHATPCLAPVMWAWFHVEKWWNTPYFLLGELGVIAAVFTGCWLVDNAREWLMKPLYRTAWMQRFLAKLDSFFIEEDDLQKQ